MVLRGDSPITSQRSSLLQRCRLKYSQEQPSFIAEGAPIEDHAQGKSRPILTLRRNKSFGGVRCVGKKAQSITGKARYGIARTSLNRTDDLTLSCCKIQV